LTWVVAALQTPAMRTLLFVAAFFAGCLLVLAQDGAVVATPDFSQARLLDLVTTRYQRTVALIKSDFPDDYATLVASLAGISWQGGNDDRIALFKASEIIKALRRKYADKVTHAPSVSHAVMLGLLAEFYDAVLKAEGPAACGRFASDGSAVLFDLGLSEKYADRLDLQSVAYFDAVVKAIEAPESPEAVRQDDWNLLLKAMVAAGAPRTYVDTIARGDRNDPDLCPALATMFRASGLLDTPEGVRTRADFARNLVGY
jgi:hypothetical protein